MYYLKETVGFSLTLPLKGGFIRERSSLKRRVHKGT